MPELPEVEVVKKSLERKITNLAIKGVKINDGNLRYKVNIKQIHKLVGKTIKKIERRSKFLIFKIEKNLDMLVHLGMTGKFFFINNKNKKIKTSFYYNISKNDHKHDRIIFFLKGKQKLIYNDIRKFGFIKFIDPRKTNKCLHLKKLGPEPLSKFYNFNYIKKYILGRKRTIKDILMDQKCVSGLGNIYVNEILFVSGIKPVRQVNKLKDFELKKILFNTKKILLKSIKFGGSSIKDFSTDEGKKGKFQQFFKIYGREGKKCSNTDCNKKVVRIIVSNRSTFFCKRCQK
tara:strand:+ start:1004 stop:1870 length:867 start_codon:yes stop_codon:yes gene_type:complete